MQDRSSFRALSILIVTAFLFQVLCAGRIAAQDYSQARAQISQQAALFALRPSKIVATLPQDILQGTKQSGQIALLNAEDQPVSALEDWPCKVSFNFPSGQSRSQTVVIGKGRSTANFEFSTNESGWTSVLVRAPSETVRSYRTEIIVRPLKKKKKRTSRPSSPALFREERIGPEFRRARFTIASARFSPHQSGDASGAHPNNSNGPVLHISVSDLGGNYIANGKDAAVISAVFESPDLSPAPTDIHIWFSWTNGSLNPSQPILIKRGTSVAKTRLTSAYPAEVHFKFVSSNPEYRAEGDTDFTIHFVPAGVALVGPDKLSVVDNAPVMIVFFDANKNPISPGKKWPVTLHSKQSKLRFTPQSFEVKDASPTGSAVLFPTAFGTDTIEAVVSNYRPEPIKVEITGWLVLGLCVAGGVAGGLAAFKKFKDSWLWRIFSGILGGAVLCWFYVFLGLPTVDANIAHNTFSVFFVALIGGYAGTAVLDLAVRKFNLPGSKTATPT